MKIQIKNLLGVESQELDLQIGIPHGITGINASGKTSITSVLAALASKSANPFAVNVTQTAGYIHRGAREGYAVMQLPDEGDIGWSTNDGIVGLDTVLSNKAAVGLVDLVNARTSSKSRIEIWEKILGANSIDTDILEPYFSGRDKKEYDAVCELITREGWDAAAEIYVAHRRMKKAEWEKIVGGGQNYSKPIASKWSPSGWLPENEKTDIETLEGELAELRNLLDGMRGEVAISQHEIDAGIEAQERINGLKTRGKKIRKITDDLRAEIFEEQTELNSLIKQRDESQKEIADYQYMIDDNKFLDKKSGLEKSFIAHQETISKLERKKQVLVDQVDRGQKNALLCPHCSEKFAITNDGVIKFDENTITEIDANVLGFNSKIEKTTKIVNDILSKNALSIKEKSNVLEKKITSNKKTIEKLHAKITESKIGGNKHVEEITKIKGQIEELEKTAQFADMNPTVGASEQSITDLKVAVREKEQSIKDYETWRAARQAHDAVCANDYIVKVLAPGGAKDKVMQERFGNIESIIKNVVECSNWSDITVDAKFSVSIAGTAAAFASKSEQWRAQFALQIAVFVFTKSKMFILDECDILDDAGWAGMVKTLDRISAKFKDRYFVFAGTSLKNIPKYYDKTEV